MRPEDVSVRAWKSFKNHLHRRKHTLSALSPSRGGRYYDVSVMQENVPIYQLRRDVPNG